MPKLHIIQTDGSKNTIKADEGWSLMEILRDAPYREVEGICGGSMACATCHIHIHPDWVNHVSSQNNEKTEEEEDILELASELCDTSRLGCQIRMSNALDGLIIALPSAKTDWKA